MVEDLPARHDPIKRRQQAVLSAQIAGLERAEIAARGVVEAIEGRSFRGGS